MWRIVRAELKYHRVNYLLFLGFVSLVCIYGVYHPMAIMIAWTMMFLAVNNWNAFRIKEKRDFQLVQLPVPRRKIAYARLALIMIPGLVFMGLCIAINVAVDPDQPINVRVVLMLYGIVVAIFSLALMFRDRFLGTKALKGGKAVIAVLLAAGVAANIYGLIAARKAAAAGLAPPLFVRAIELFKKYNPSASNPRVLAFLGVCLVLACLTVVTFERRRTHIE
jgi:hypothetical protein